VICSRCGRTVASDLNFCPHCGFKFNEPPSRPAGHALGPSELRASAGEGRSTLKVAIAIAALLIILPIAVSALIYFTVLGFGDDTNPPPDSLLLMSPTADGYSFSFSAMSQSIKWNDVKIVLDDVTWDVVASALDNGANSKVGLGSERLGDLSVWCNVTDLLGNGMADNGDFFTLESGGTPSFVGTGSHTVRVIYQPTADTVCSATFSA